MFRSLFCLVVCLIPVAAPLFAQTLTGLVRDEKNQPVAYANIGIPDLKTGTVADEAGRFRLDISKARADQNLLVSAVGYDLKTFPIRTLRTTPTLTVTLAERVNQLRDVRVAARRSREHRLGNKPGGVVDITFGSSLLGSELAIPIRLNRPAFIKRVNISLEDNENDSIQVRINFYPAIAGKPGDNLLRRSIVTRLPKGEQDFSLDVSAEQIVLEADFFLGVEVVHCYSNGDCRHVGFKAGAFNGPTYIRHTSQSPLEKVDDSVFNAGAAFSVTALY